MLLQIKVLAFALFSYQMQQALAKYMKKNSMATLETKDLVDAKLPSILLCLLDQDQFSLRSGAFLSFLQGEVRGASKTVSWTDKQNKSFEDIIKQNFQTMDDSRDDFKINGDYVSLEQAFTVFDGYCKKIDVRETIITNSMDLITITTYAGNRFQVFIADPDLALYHAVNTDSFWGELIIPDPKESNIKYYSLDLEEIHRSEDRGECTNYGKDGPFRSYADCVEKEYEKQFEPMLGCLVPWLARPANPMSCKTNLILPDDIYKNFTQMVQGLESKLKSKLWDYSSACRKPCIELVINSKLTKKLDRSKVEYALKIKKEVKVTKYVDAYGIFDLIVEVGSSLGLWIGLSAVGILDLLLDMVISTQNNLKNY